MALDGLLAIIIDKDLDLTALISKELENVGLTCQTITEFRSPQEVIKILEDKAPRIIFIDVDPGDESKSLQLLVEIKNSRRYGEIPVIITSKEKHKKLETKVMESGAFKYFVKPIPKIELDLVLKLTDRIVSNIKLEKEYAEGDSDVEFEVEFRGQIEELNEVGFILTSPVRFDLGHLVELNSTLLKDLSLSKSVKRIISDIGFGSGGYRSEVEFLGLDKSGFSQIDLYRKR